MSKIWEITFGCAEQYICTYALYLMSVLLQCYAVINDWGIGAPGHGKELLYRLNAIDKRYIYQLMSNFKLSGSKLFDSQMQMQTSTQNNDISLAK